MLFKGLNLLAALTLSGSALAATTTGASPATSTASATGAVNTAAGTGNFTFKDTYPAAGSVPVPKPEWVALLNTSAIAKAPVLSNNGGGMYHVDGLRTMH
jgi:hypothetical protein